MKLLLLIFSTFPLVTFSQGKIYGIDTVLVKKYSDQTYQTYIDTIRKSHHYSSSSVTVESGCIFYGAIKNNQPWNGKSYCFDDFGLLDHIEIYKDGNYVGNGVIGKEDE